MVRFCPEICRECATKFNDEFQKLTENFLGEEYFDPALSIAPEKKE
jgi:hypothetical protein